MCPFHSIAIAVATLVALAACGGQPRVEHPSANDTRHVDAATTPAPAQPEVPDPETQAIGLVLVLDRSGSMMGEKFEHVKASLRGDSGPTAMMEDSAMVRAAPSIVTRVPDERQ